jgi:adenine phosphoribosyltransferase
MDFVRFTDYTKSEKSLAMRKGAIRRDDRVLIVDEWIETGAQAKAAIKLIERMGGRVAGIATLNADSNGSTEVLLDMYNCRPVHVSKR